MRVRHVILLLLIGWGNINFAQDSVVLTKNFKFKDGIFVNFEDFKNNTPTYAWDEVEAGVYTNPQTFMSQMHFLKIKKGEALEALDLQKIWGFSLDGIPYIRLPKGAVKKQNTTFAGLKLRGKICYFAYEDYEKKMFPMSVYNPLTGKPFRTMDVERKVLVQYEKMLIFEDGTIEDFTIKNFKKYIQNDKALLKTVNELSAAEASEKLFKCLLIYDDRHPIKISK